MIPAHGGVPYGPQVPVLCMDGQPVQLPEGTRVPVAATKDHAKRVGYEYGRAGTATVRRHRDVARGNRRLVERCERVATRRRLADEDRRRPLQTEIGLLDNEDVAEE